MKHTTDTLYICFSKSLCFRIIKDKQATVYDRMHYVYVVKLLTPKKLLIK